MDYIQEELRRQREALACLLLGGTVFDGGQEEGTGGTAFPGQAWRGAEASFPAAGPLPEAAGDVSAIAGDLLPRAAGRFSQTAGFFPETVWPGQWNGDENGGGGKPLPSPGEYPESLTTAAYREGKGLSRTAKGGMEVESAERTAAEAVWALAAGTAGGRVFGGKAAEGAALSRRMYSGGDHPFPAASGVFPEEGQTRLKTVTELVIPPSGAGTEAKDLSRAFQRDARRYDGGFTLY